MEFLVLFILAEPMLEARMYANANNVGKNHYHYEVPAKSKTHLDDNTQPYNPIS